MFARLATRGMIARDVPLAIIFQDPIAGAAPVLICSVSSVPIHRLAVSARRDMHHQHV